MARFILIDGSLRDGRGHHDSYARRILQSAERFGYRVVIAPNRAYSAAPLPAAWRCEPLFEHSVYDDPLLMPDWGDAAPQGAMLKLRNLSERWQTLRQRPRRGRIVSSHAAGFHALFDRIHPRPGDQIFLAAASELVLAGLAAAAERDSRIAAVDWHAIFHFNNLIGRPHEYAAQSFRRTRLTRVLTAAEHALGHARLHLYATTAELAAELSSLGVLHVRELGYPIDDALRTCGRQPRRPGPLRITFAGDARLEKGFQHMPAIVDAVRADSQLASRVEFVIQANFTFRLPCRRRNLPIVAAREALQRHDPAKVQLLREPLDEAAYRRLILDADLFVLPYDARHYFARCSGVLVEALSAGIPVIAPANCWMGEQFARVAPSNAATSDVPPGLVANRPDEIPLLVRRIVDDYDRYRAAAAKFAVAWTRWHHPTRAIAEMLSGAATLDAIVPRSHPHAPPLTDRRSA
jgi:glycosyltransferase involved in cell wall biosynthesis